MPFNFAAFNFVATVMSIIADGSKGIYAAKQQADSLSAKTLYYSARELEESIESMWSKLREEDHAAILRKDPTFPEAFQRDKKKRVVESTATM